MTGMPRLSADAALAFAMIAEVDAEIVMLVIIVAAEMPNPGSCSRPLLGFVRFIEPTLHVSCAKSTLRNKR